MPGRLDLHPADGGATVAGLVIGGAFLGLIGWLADTGLLSVTGAMSGS